MIQGRPLSFDRKDALQKAMGLFWARGYEPLGVSELLKGMGIPRQSFYNTFGSKEELFVEAFEAYCADMGSQFMGIFAASPSPLAGLHGMFDFIEEKVKAGGCEGCLIGNTIAEFGGKDTQIGRAAERAMRSKLTMLTGAFKAAIDQGELAADLDPKAMAGTMMALNQGLALMSKSTQDADELLTIVKTTRRLLLG